MFIVRECFEYVAAPHDNERHTVDVTPLFISILSVHREAIGKQFIGDRDDGHVARCSDLAYNGSDVIAECASVSGK
jgi:hypothetical protein